MQAPLAAADPGKVWLLTVAGKYVQMSPEARGKVLANAAQVVEQFCPHGLPLPEAHEDEVERAKVAAMKAEFMSSEVQRTADVRVRMSVNLQAVAANVARFGAHSCSLDAVALRAVPAIADSVLRNAANLKGAIAVVERGVNAFVEKALRVQEAGAVGVIIINTDDSPYVPLGSPLGGDEGVFIPVVCVQLREGSRFRNPANVTLEFGEPAPLPPQPPLGAGADAAGSAGGAGAAGAGEEASQQQREDEGTAEAMLPDPSAVSFLVTVPEGQRGGSRMVVTAPDGRSVAIDVPVGAVAGQQLQVNLPAAVAGAVDDDDDDDEYDEDGPEYDEDDYTEDEDYDEEDELERSRLDELETAGAYDDADYSDEEGEDEEGAGVGFSPRRGDDITTAALDSDTAGAGAEPAGVESEAPQTFLVTLPEDFESGQQIRVQAPDGRSAVITVPAGIGNGQQLRVQLPPATPTQSASSTPQSGIDPPPPMPQPELGEMEPSSPTPAPAPATPQPAAPVSPNHLQNERMQQQPAQVPAPAPSPGAPLPAGSSLNHLQNEKVGMPAPAPAASQPPHPAGPPMAPAPAPAPAATPQAAASQPMTLTIVVPEGVTGGQQLRVQAPDGRTAMITVPVGVLAGQQLRLTLPPVEPTDNGAAATPPAAAPAAATSSPPATQPAPGVGWGKTKLTPGAEQQQQAAAHGADLTGSQRADQILSGADQDAPERADAAAAAIQPAPGLSRSISGPGASERCGPAYISGSDGNGNGNGSGRMMSQLPPPESGKHWYRDTDGELRELTVPQRRVAITNLREQGMAAAVQVDDAGGILPVPPELDMELRALPRPGSNDGFMLSLWSYMTGADLLPANPQFPTWV